MTLLTTQMVKLNSKTLTSKVMTEDQLQFQIVTWFHNNIPSERGYLYRTENKTNKGARDKGLGLIKGVSDLHYHAPCGRLLLIELKAPKMRHSVAHLEEQLKFIAQHEKRGAVGFFVFSLDQFQHIIANTVPDGLNIGCFEMAKKSIRYIEDVVKQAKIEGRKTVELNYKFLEE